MVFIPFGRFVAGTTHLHLLDPRVKLFGAVVLISTALVVKSWMELGIVAIIAIIATFSARVPLRCLIRDLWTLRFLYLVTIIMHCFLWEGDVLVDLPAGLKITARGIERGLFFSTKIALLIAFIGPLMRTTHPSVWTDLFKSSSGSGYFQRKVIRPLALTLGIAIRFLPLILGEAERIRWAQVSRGFNYHGSLLKRVRALKLLLIPLTASSFSKVDIITTAMQSRSFHLDRKRTVYRSHHLRMNDFLSVTIILIALLIVVLI